MTDTEALMVLNAVEGVGPARIRKLVAEYGSAVLALSATSRKVAYDGVVPADVAANILEFPADSFLKNEYNLMRQDGVTVLSYRDEGYPRLLAEISDPPVVLYLRGTLPTDAMVTIALVGSRRASMYGMSVAHMLASRLAASGVCVVSGLARGIDSAAHHGALTVGGYTVGVLGCGLAHVYPPEHKDLYGRIASQGSVVSEFPMQTPPLAYNFPRRNRIIAGLSFGTVVVEAAARSGALITAHCALDQGREVYAVPGKIDSPVSNGVHALIKEGAKLVTGVDDILEDLAAFGRTVYPLAEVDASPISTPEKNEPAEPAALQQKCAVVLTENEQDVYARLGDEPLNIDKIAEMCNIESSLVGATLFRLEMKRLVRQLPGKHFVRV